MGDDDAACIDRVRQGEREAYGELVLRHQRRLRLALAYYCRGTEELDEIVQEAFVCAFDRLADFDRERPFYPWLKTIALNVLRQQARRRQTVRLHREAYLHYLQERMVLDDADGERRIEALRRCLDQLGPAQVELLKEKYAGERSIAELAASRDTSDGAVKLRLLRLRNALRKCIERRLVGELD